MKTSTFDDAVSQIQDYLSHSNFRPFFVISERAADCEKFRKIFGKSLTQIRISDFCVGDFLLDHDLFIEKLLALKTDAICFGLGEYIYFTSQEEILLSLYDRSFDRKIVFICAGISGLLTRLADRDPKFRAKNLCQIGGREDFSVVKYSPNINVETFANSFHDLLKLAEDGKKSISVRSDLPLSNVRVIQTFYDALKHRLSSFNIASDALSEEQWQEYFRDDRCEGFPADHWRTFAYGFREKFSNPYLQFVFDRSKNFEAYQKNLFFAILEVTNPKIFETLYPARKNVIKNLKSQYFFEYLAQLENLTDIVKYLTDNTVEERCMMIRAVQGREKIPDILEKNYPAIRDYLLDYDFDDDEVTRYFRRYKKIKLCSLEDENFKRQVETLAAKVNRFETRQAILDRADKNSKLYWLDAMGVEFLSYIRECANQIGIFSSIEVARSELPTLTSTNRSFFDDWSGEKFPKNQKLDDLKHSNSLAPMYVEEELRIIDEVIEEIRNSLMNRESERVILTSDHGASRLAVMFGEKKYQMTSAGEHGGRCCLKNEIDEKPACAVEENGWWVMTNYDRFSGGRLSSVETHGGATLEEILIPVIEFSLQNPNKIPQKSPDDAKVSKPVEEDDSFDFLSN